MASHNILIIGGTGFVGTAIAAKLAARDPRITLTMPTRRRERAKHLILLPRIDVAEVSVHDDAALAALVAGKDAVINLVGVLHSDIGSPYGERFKRAHVDLPGRIARACANAGVPRLLHMSSLGVAADAPSMYLRSKADGEKAVLAVEGLATTIFRPSVIFGRDDKFLNLFARMQRIAPFVPLGGADAKMQPIWVEDVASAFVNALDERKTFGKTYELAGPKVYTLRELVRYAGGVNGQARKVLGLPDGLARLQAWSMEFCPVEMLSRDNLDSLKIDSVLKGAPVASAAPELGVDPAAMESVAPQWMARVSSRAKLNAYRDHAGR
jgi:uncharacterized protein YbjT (DUF2867 family)